MEFWESMSSISTWMKLENIVKKSQIQRDKDHVNGIHLLEITGVGKLIETKVE